MPAGYGAVHATIANSLQGLAGAGVTTNTGGAGSVTMSTAGRMLWGRDEGTNSSLNMNDWSHVELQNFVKWFIEVNYPEAVKQYQAVRDIERQAEESARLEYEAKQAEFMRQYWANQARGAQNAYQYPTTATQQKEPQKQSFWEKIFGASI